MSVPAGSDCLHTSPKLYERLHNHHTHLRQDNHLCYIQQPRRREDLLNKNVYFWALSKLRFYDLLCSHSLCHSRVILIEKISESPIVHVPKLFPLLHWFQNTFCFLCSSTPSHGGSFFLKIAIYNGDIAGGISVGHSSQKLWPKIHFWKFPQQYPQLHLKWLPTWEGVELQRKQNVF